MVRVRANKGRFLPDLDDPKGVRVDFLDVLELAATAPHPSGLPTAALSCPQLPSAQPRVHALTIDLRHLPSSQSSATCNPENHSV